MKKIFYTSLLAIGIYVSGCTPSRYVQPLAEKQTAVTAHFGGPLIGFAGTTIPIPLTSVAVGHGFSDKLTGYAGLHTTSLGFGNLQLDAGALYGFLQPKGWQPGISASLAGNMILRPKTKAAAGAFDFYPQTDVNLYWQYGQNKSFTYAGASAWYELNGTRSHNEVQPRAIMPVLQVGQTFARPKMNYTLEVKYLGLGVRSDSTVVVYNGIANKGTLGVYFGISKKFGAKQAN